VQGAGVDAESHRKFYNEYLAVMDISAEFYLQTVETVFQKHALPKGDMVWKDPFTGLSYPVKPGAIKRTALLTIEGELDDISAHGQTTAAHEISTSLPAEKQFHHFQENVGHYGIFNGSKWRGQIMPRVRHFIRAHDAGRAAIPEKDLQKIPDIAPAQYDHAVHGIEAVRARKRSATEPNAAAHNEKSGFYTEETV
jgi:poly(3-hydroxybutyrate) depolymerase